MGVYKDTKTEDTFRKELYRSISEGDFSPETIRRIEQEYKSIKNEGKSFNRLDGPLREGMLGGLKTLAQASIICRADEIAGTKNPRGSYEGERECGARQERLIEDWARKTDRWFDLSNLDPDLLISSGGESEVYRYDDQTVMKINTIRYTVSPQLLLDRISIHNTLFPSTAMKVQGFGRNDLGEFCVIYTQPYVEGTKPTRAQIDALLKEIGEGSLEEYGNNGGHNYKNPMFLFDDLHEENIIVSRTGKLHVIDSDIRLNTPELKLGGRYIIPPVEEDFILQNKNTEEIAMKERTSAAASTSSSNNIRLEGPVYSCVVKDMDDGSVSAMLELCTAVRDNNSDDRKYKNHQYHRVRITATGEKAEQLKAIEKNSRALIEKIKGGNKEDIATMDLLDTVEINGRLRASKDGSYLFVDVKGNNFSVAKRLRMNNQAEMLGKVVETSCNKAWARMLIKVPAQKGESVIVPVCISAKDNPQKYEQMSRNELEKGSTVKIKGPLTSKTYANGDSRLFVCSIKIKNYEVLTKKKEVKTARTTSPGL